MANLEDEKGWLDDMVIDFRTMQMLDDAWRTMKAPKRTFVLATTFWSSFGGDRLRVSEVDSWT